MSARNTPTKSFGRIKSKKPGVLEILRTKETRSVPIQMSERTFTTTTTTTDIELAHSDEPHIFSRKSNAPNVNFQPKTTTFDNIPLVLENSFRFIEKVTINNQISKPFSMMSKGEIENYIDSFKEEKLSKYVKEKQIGKYINSLSLKKLNKIGIDEIKAKHIRQSILDYEMNSKIGKHILLMKNDSNNALRKMFSVFKMYDENEIKQLNDMSQNEAHLVAFMSIRNYFAQKQLYIVDDKKVHTLLLSYDQFKNDESQLMDEVIKFIGNLRFNDGVILLRTLKFAHRMVSNTHSCYYYYKFLFLQTIFSFIFQCDQNELAKLYFLVDIINKLVPKKLRPKIERVFESDELYAGEIILEGEQISKLPFYVVLNQEQLNKENLNLWATGKLYLTNYRLIWRTTNESLGSMMHCFFFNQVPIKMIYDVMCVTGPYKEPSCPICLRIVTWDNRLLLFSLKNKEKVRSFEEKIRYMMDYVRKNEMKIDDCEQFLSTNVFENIWEKTALRLGVDIKSPSSLFYVQNNTSDVHRCLFEGIVFRNYPLIDDSKLFSDDFIRPPVLIHRDASGSYLFKLQYISNEKPVSSQLKFPIALKQILTAICTNETFFVTSNYDANPTFLRTNKAAHDAIYAKIVKVMSSIDEKSINELNSAVDSFISYQETILSVTMNIIADLIRGNSVIFLPNTQNASEISIYSSLVPLLTDPFYRSFEGFIELIFKEFVQYGYFKTISKQGLYPVHFLAFLMMAYSFMYSYPNQFGINSKLIRFLHQHCNSGRFSAFEQNPTQGLFLYLIKNKEIFVNGSFERGNFDFLSKHRDSELCLVRPQYFFFRWMNYTNKQTDLFNTTAEFNFDLHQRSLTEIPPYIKDVSKARFIDLSNNPLMTIPENLNTLTALQGLVISNCKMYCIPKHYFTSLVNLTLLDVSCNSNTKCTFGIPILHPLTNLRVLDLSSQVFRRKKDIDSFQFPVNLKTLILSNCVKQLPHSLTCVSGLESLDISKNICISLDVLPRLKSLNELILSSCEEQTLPNEISCLVNLTKLDISKNGIMELPHWLFDMTELKDLNLSSNKLKFISIKHTQLTSLTRFDAGDNPIHYLPTKHPLLDPTIRCYNPPVVKKIHVLSSSTGLDIMKLIAKELISSSINSVDFLNSEEDHYLLKTTKKNCFTFDYNDTASSISFELSRNDCYLIVLTSKELDIVYHWKYHLNLLLPQDIPIYILLIADIKPTEKNYIESTVKDIFNKCEFLYIPKGKDIGKACIDKFCEWICKFKSKWENENNELLEINQELLYSGLSKQIVYREELEKIIGSFIVSKENINVYIRKLVENGTIISSYSVMDVIKHNCPELLKTIPNFDEIGEIFILKRKIFDEIYKLLQSYSSKGIGLLCEVYDKLKWCGEMNINIITFVLFLMELHDMLTIYNDEWFENFGLIGYYNEFKQIHGLEAIRMLLCKSFDSRGKLLLNSDDIIKTTKQSNVKLGVEGSTSKNDENTGVTQEQVPFLPFALHNELSVITPTLLEKIWPQQLEKGGNEYSWAFSSYYVPKIFYDTLTALILVSNSKIINIFRLYLFVEIFESDHKYKLMLNLEYSKLIIKVRTEQDIDVNALAFVEFISKLNKKMKEILSFYSQELVSNEIIMCPMCRERNVADIGEISVEHYKTTIRRNNDIIYCTPCGAKGLLKQHSILLSDISVEVQLEVLYEDFSDLFVEGSKIKIKKDIVEENEYSLYEVFYNNEQLCMKTFSNHANNGKVSGLKYLGNVISIMMREAIVAKTVSHPHFLTLRGISLRPLAILVDHCDQNLNAFIHSPKSVVDWKTNLEFIIQICTGMKKLHSIKMVHRNLKPKSILIRINEETKERYAVIADFGLTTPDSVGNKMVSFCDGRYNDISSFAYIAPEILQDQEFKPECDVYSFGIILWEIAQRLHPYEKNKQSSSLYQDIINGTRPTPNVKTPYSQLNKLVVKCWHSQPANRPSFEVLCTEFEGLRNSVLKSDKKK